MATRAAVGYVRVSTQEQVEGFGLDSQRKAIRDYCKQHDLRLVRIVADEGQSGSNGLDSRVGLVEALAAVKGREAQAIVVKRLDRLARDFVLQETLVVGLVPCTRRLTFEWDVRDSPHHQS